MILAMAAGFPGAYAGAIGDHTEAVDYGERGPFESEGARANFHFTNAARRQILFDRSVSKANGLRSIMKTDWDSFPQVAGEYLHALQDSYSHVDLWPSVGTSMAAVDRKRA